MMALRFCPSSQPDARQHRRQRTTAGEERRAASATGTVPPGLSWPNQPSRRSLPVGLKGETVRDTLTMPAATSPSAHSGAPKGELLRETFPRLPPFDTPSPRPKRHLSCCRHETPESPALIAKPCSKARPVPAKGEIERDIQVRFLAAYGFTIKGEPLRETFLRLRHRFSAQPTTERPFEGSNWLPAHRFGASQPSAVHFRRSPHRKGETPRETFSLQAFSRARRKGLDRALGPALAYLPISGLLIREIGPLVPMARP